MSITTLLLCSETSTEVTADSQVTVGRSENPLPSSLLSMRGHWQVKGECMGEFLLQLVSLRGDDHAENES